MNRWILALIFLVLIASAGNTYFATQVANDITATQEAQRLAGEMVPITQFFKDRGDAMSRAAFNATMRVHQLEDYIHQNGLAIPPERDTPLNLPGTGMPRPPKEKSDAVI